MKFENTEVWGFKHAFRGMRNPLESWNKSDSDYCKNLDCKKCEDNKDCEVAAWWFHIGKNDLALAQSLIKAGSEHRKFSRQIFVSVDITAPLYWWKEFDTYKVGTVANSTSTMHKLASTQITMDCFEMDDFEHCNIESEDMIFPLESCWNSLVSDLEFLRQKYNELKGQEKFLNKIKDFDEAKKANIQAKRFWKELIRLLPESWLQKRTITMNYENILNMIHQRKNHKLNEWSGVDNPANEIFIKWAKTLPYAEEFLFL